MRTPTRFMAACVSLALVASSCNGCGSGAGGGAGEYVPQPEDRVIAVVALIEDAGGDVDTMYIDPTAVDAVLLTSAAETAYYEGTGNLAGLTLADILVRDPRSALYPGASASAGGCPLHCWRSDCFCLCDEVVGLKAIGLMLSRAGGITEAWWVNPAVVQAVFPMPEGATQFTGGVARDRVEGDPEGLLIPEVGALPPLPGNVAFGRT